MIQKAKRLLAAFMAAAVTASMTTPFVYAADDTKTDTASESAVSEQKPVVTATDNDDPDFSTSMTYDSSYESTAPEGSTYAGTLSSLGMNVYKQTYTYADLGFSSAAEMEEAYAEASKAADEAAQEAHDRNMAWLDSMLTDEDLAPMREEAEQVSEAADLLLGDTEIDRPVAFSSDLNMPPVVTGETATGETASTPESAATPETAAGRAANGIATYSMPGDDEALAEKKAAAAAFLEEKGIDLTATQDDAGSHFSVTPLGDEVAVQDAASGGSASANITVVDDDSVVVYVYDENDQPLNGANVYFQWKYKNDPNADTYQTARRYGRTTTVDGKDGVALIPKMGEESEDKTTAHRGYAWVSCEANGKKYRTVEQLDADFDAGSRVNFKLTPVGEDNGIYASTIDLDGVNLLDTKYTLNLSSNSKADTSLYDLTITLRNLGASFALEAQSGAVALVRTEKDVAEPGQILDELPVGYSFTATKWEMKNEAAPAPSQSPDGGDGSQQEPQTETSYTAVFKKAWTSIGYGTKHVLGPGENLYIYWLDTAGQWHRYSKINMDVKQADNDAWWKELNLSLTGTGDGTLTLPGGLGELNIDILHFNMYATLDLSGKFMVGYGRDWLQEKDKDKFESSAYKPSGRRWSQMGERMRDSIAETVSRKEFMKEFTKWHKVVGDWNASFDIYGCIMAQWNPTSGYFSGDVIMSCGFSAGGSFTGYAFIPIPPVGVPAYFGIEGSGSGRFTADLGAQFKADDFATFLRTLQVSNSTGATMAVNLSAAVYGGVGLRNFLSAEVNLACSLDMIFGFGTANTQGMHYPFHTQGIFDWGISIRARILFVTYKYTLPFKWPMQDHTLWDKWCGDPIGNYKTQALLMETAAQDAREYQAYRTDMKAVSEGVYDSATGEANVTGNAVAVQSMPTNSNENMLGQNVLSGASMQLLTAKGGKNKGTSYLFRIASFTDSTTGQTTPRLTVTNGGKCDSSLQGLQVLPGPTEGEDAGKVPHDYNFAVCDDSDGGTGNFTIAVTTGYLDDSHSLKERTRDLRIRVYRFDSETNRFTLLQTLMPPETETSGYCGTPAVYTYKDQYFVAAPILHNVNIDQLLNAQIANNLAWVTNIKQYDGDGQVHISRIRKFSRIMLKPEGSHMTFYLEDSDHQMMYRYLFDDYFGIRKHWEGYFLSVDNIDNITNLTYINGCPGRRNWIVFTADNKLWFPYARTDAEQAMEETYSFALKDSSGNEIPIPTAENSLLIFSDDLEPDPNKYSWPQAEEVFHVITVTSEGDADTAQENKRVKPCSRIYSYDFAYQSVEMAESKDHHVLVCPNAVRNQIQVLQDRNVSIFTAAYHKNVSNPDNKDLRMIYLADDTDVETSQPDDENDVGIVRSSSDLYNFEWKKGKDAAVTNFSIANKTVDKKNNSFEVSFTVKNTGTSSLNSVTLGLKNGNDDLTIGRTKNLNGTGTTLTLTGNLQPGAARSYTAYVGIPASWLSGKKELTMGITQIDGKSLSEWGNEVVPNVVAYADNGNVFDAEHTASDTIDAPTVDMRVEEQVYMADTKEAHYAEVTFSNDNLLNIENAELQVYGFTDDDTDGTEYSDLKKLGTYNLGMLYANGQLNQQNNASYTVLLPLLDEWRHQGDKDNIWFLYFVLCEQGADPFSLDATAPVTTPSASDEEQPKQKTVYDIEFLSNIDEKLTATVKTYTEDPFRGRITSDTDGAYLPDTEVTIKAEAEEGYIFDGWYYTDKDKTEQCLSKTAETNFTTAGDTVYNLEARFQEDPKHRPGRVIVVTSTSKEGTDYPNSDPLGRVTVKGGEARMMEDGSTAYAIFPGDKLTLKAEVYDPEHYMFAGWRRYDVYPEKEYLSTDAEYIYDKGTSAYIIAEFVPIPQSCVKVYLDAVEGYGSGLGWQRTGTDGKLASLPTPQNDGYTFLGWYTDPDGGEKVSTDTVFTQKTMLYAHYAAGASPVQPDTPVTPSQPGGTSGSSDTANRTNQNSSAAGGNITADSAAAANKTAAVPRTADDFPLTWIVVLLAVGAGGFCAVLILRKRRKK